MSQTSKQKALKKILKASLQGKLNEAEQKAVDSWYDQLDKNTSSIPLLDDPDQRAFLEKSIKNHLNEEVIDKLGKRKTNLQDNYIKYAAIFFFCLSIGMLGYPYLNKDKKKSTSAIIFTSAPLAAKLVTLKDGSKILLNVSSQLTIEKDFGAKDRRVSLIGEAFFEIAKDKKRPFIIRSGQVNTSVLGTSFNINAYPDRDKIKIGVVSGKVSVSSVINGSTLAREMTRGTTLSYYTKTKETVLKTEAMPLISAWKDNRLYIDNATIIEISNQLERYYHIKVVMHNQVHNGKRYTIRFDKDPANRVMEILSMLTKRKFIYQTNQITIK
ncbi:FecR family protein [Pedobacter sp. N23S346]|uniref:FecR family protein n=1 Tax=Pedobacter sp. N23S346 TaxID=3402750 RepID=UPI003AC4390D